MRDDKDLGWETEDGLRWQTKQQYLADGWIYLKLSLGTATHLHMVSLESWLTDC